MKGWQSVLLFLLHLAHGERYYGSKDNVGRLVSQRKVAYQDVPYCEWCRDEEIGCKTDLKGYYKDPNEYRADREYKECRTGILCLQARPGDKFSLTITISPILLTNAF